MAKNAIDRKKTKDNAKKLAQCSNDLRALQDKLYTHIQFMHKDVWHGGSKSAGWYKEVCEFLIANEKWLVAMDTYVARLGKFSLEVPGA